MSSDIYRPVTEKAINPYKIPDILATRGFFEENDTILSAFSSPDSKRLPTYDSFSLPPVGLDGGIIVPEDVVTAIEDPVLSGYLRQRLMPIRGQVKAAVHDAESGELFVYKSGKKDWRTSRGDSYYSPNITFSLRERRERSDSLLVNLQQDTDLTHAWQDRRAAIDQLGPESRWRVLSALYQNFVNDVVAVSYGQRINSQLTGQPEDRVLEKGVFNLAASYYRVLLGCELMPEVEEDLFKVIPEVAAAIPQLESDLPDEVDWVRTRRETDMTYLTLAGALSFINEFESRQDVPVVIPLLGAYDIGPALTALGWKGEIQYVLPAHKESKMEIIDDSYAPRQRSIEHDVGSELADKGSIILFDDTVGSGRTIRRMDEQFVARGITIEAIRTLFVNHWHQNELAEFRELFGERYQAYYQFPILRKPRYGNNQFIFPRFVSQLWFRR